MGRAIWSQSLIHQVNVSHLTNVVEPQEQEQSLNPLFIRSMFSHEGTKMVLRFGVILSQSLIHQVNVSHATISSVQAKESLSQSLIHQVNVSHINNKELSGARKVLSQSLIHQVNVSHLVI